MPASNSLPWMQHRNKTGSPISKTQEFCYPRAVSRTYVCKYDLILGRWLVFGCGEEELFKMSLIRTSSCYSRALSGNYAITVQAAVCKWLAFLMWESSKSCTDCIHFKPMMLREPVVQGTSPTSFGVTVTTEWRSTGSFWKVSNKKFLIFLRKRWTQMQRTQAENQSKCLNG